MTTTRFSLILLALCLHAGLAAVEAQVMVATWELNQKVRQLRLDISTQQGGISQILDRCSVIMQENPNHLVQNGQQFVPIQDILMSDLNKQDLLKSWIDYASEAADDLLGSNTLDEHALLFIAQTYPRTDAAEKAWQQLADISWDRGHLGSYLYYATRSKESDLTKRSGRIEAAQQLLSFQTPHEIPQHLDRVDAIWKVSLPVFHQRQQKRVTSNLIRHTHTRKPGSMPYQVSRGNKHTLALCNGINMVILDPLLGRQLGQVHNLGNNRYGIQSNQAFVSDDHVIAIGGNSNGLYIIACDRLGQLLWRSPINDTSSVSFASRPIVLDNKIFLSTIQYNNSSERIDLIALDLDGNQLWRKIVAQVTGVRPRYNQGLNDLSPDMCVHRGRLALLSNRGVIAQISSEGHVISLDTYPTKKIDMRFVRGVSGSSNNANTRSAGTIFSDGLHLLATPIDCNGILASAANDRGFRLYSGDGQSAQLLDVHKNRCLLIDDKIRMLDLDKLELMWSADRPRSKTTTPWGRIGQNHSLVAVSQRISMHENSSGEIKGQISHPDQQRIVMHNGLILYISERTVSGRGDSTAFEQTLMQASIDAPHDYQPRIALSALRRAQGKSIEAFNFLLQAIELGAPQSYSENAAQIIRPHLYLTLNNDEFDSYLNHLKRLLAIDKNFDQEMAWWRARRAEYQKDIQKAITLYKSMQRPQPRYLTLTNGLEGDLNSIALASIHRLQNQEAPWQSTPPIEQIDHFKPWDIEGASPIKPFTSGPYIIAFINSFLRCYDARNGKEIWRQDTTDALPMLGVTRSPGGAQAMDARVLVLDGMTAQTIGLKHNDNITKLNDYTINQWTDIIKAVSDTGCGEEFRITVKRGNETLDFTGVLGARPMQATQANSKSVICRNVDIQLDQRRPGRYTTNPDAINTPFVDIYDIKTGELLWHHTLDTKTNMPVLTNNDLLLETVKGDLVARDIRHPEHPIRWVAKGRGHELNDYQLRDQVLISIDHTTSKAILRNTTTGTLLYSIPANPLYEMKLVGDQFICTLPDGHLSLWQLSTGEMLWTAQETLLKPVATSKNTIFCRTARDQLISIDRTNGLIHRRYPQWSQVYAHKTNGSMLFLACINKEQDNTIAGIHLESGNIIWQHPFSSDLQFNNIIIPHDRGAFYKLSSDDDRNGFVHIKNDGKIHSFIPIAPYDSFARIGQQIVVSGSDGMRISDVSEQVKQRTITYTQVAGEIDNYEEFIKKHIGKVKWKEIAGNEFGIIKHKGITHIICRFKNNNQRMRMRLGLDGPLFDTESALLLFKSMFPITLHVAANWQLKYQCQFNHSDDDKLIRACGLAPPPMRPATSQIFLHVDQWQSNSKDIWWLRKFWFRLESDE